MRTFTKVFTQLLGVVTVVGFVLVGCVQASPTGEDSDGGGNDSGTAPGDTTPPAEVTSMGAAVADGSVTLSWTDPADPDFDGVQITWTPGGSSPVSVSPGAETYQATGLINDTVHTFTIKTIDADGNESAGVTMAATPTAPDVNAPGDVTGLSALEGDGYVELTWNDPADADLEEILVTFVPGGTTPLTVPDGAEQITVIGLTNGQAYTFTVKAQDGEGNTSPGVSIGATPQVPDTTPPGAPTIAGVADGTLTNGNLTFSVSGLETGASVESSTNNGDTWSAYTGQVTLSSEGIYTITARQTDASGNTSANAVPVSAEIDKTAPGPVGGRNASPGETSATITWNDPSDANLSDILITWSPGSGSATVPAGTESYTATGLAPGERYVFSLRARDGAGNTGPSRTVAADIPLSGELGGFAQLALEHTEYDAKRGWTTSLFLLGEQPPVASVVGDGYDPGLGEVSDILLAQFRFDTGAESPSLPLGRMEINPESTDGVVYEAQFAVNLTYDFGKNQPVSADHAGATPDDPMAGEGAENEYRINGGFLLVDETKEGYEVSFEFELDTGSTVTGKYAGAIDFVDYPAPPQAAVHWPFDGDANDAVGALDLAGDVTYTEGRDGAKQSAVSFDGKAERLELSMGEFANHPINNLGEDGISFSFWMSDFGRNAGSSIFARWPEPSMQGPYSYDLQFTSSEGFEVWAGPQQRVSDTVPATAFGRGWNHVVVTWGFSTDQLEIYVNGVSEYVGDVSPFENYEQMRLIPRIGFADNEERIRDEFHGAIDDFRIYDSAIELQDVLMLYHE